MKMNRFLRLAVLCLCLIMACQSVAFAAADKLDDDSKTVKSIEVKELPSKVEYFTKEEFNLEGGVILVTYEDGSTAELSMTSSQLEVNKPNTSKTGSKNVGIKYRGKKTSFKISVAAKGLTVTFRLGSGAEDIQKNVTKGAAVKAAEAPAWEGHTFQGWYADAEGQTAFDATAAVTEDTMVYAKWEKTKTGVSAYSFEAEDVNLNQKAGPGYSGENAGISMIVTNKDVQASNEKFVAYQCRYGNSLEFNLASDGEADAVLYVRLAAEFSDMTLTPDIYEISVNGEPLQYKDISLTMAEGSQQGTFEDYLVGTVHLNKGENLIQLKTVNHEALGGTLTATAPIIDSIRVETEAVVIWDGAFGLPMKNY